MSTLPPAKHQVASEQQRKREAQMQAVTARLHAAGRYPSPEPSDDEWETLRWPDRTLSGPSTVQHEPGEHSPPEPVDRTLSGPTMVKHEPGGPYGG